MEQWEKGGHLGKPHPQAKGVMGEKKFRKKKNHYDGKGEDSTDPLRKGRKKKEEKESEKTVQEPKKPSQHKKMTQPEVGKLYKAVKGGT